MTPRDPIPEQSPDRDAVPALTPVATVCGGGTCPTVYRTDRGTFVVQGYALSAANAGIDVPPGEQLVEIPASLFTAAREADA